MNGTNGVLEALLCLGYRQYKDGFWEDAIETFSAAEGLDRFDERAARARELVCAQREGVPA